MFTMFNVHNIMYIAPYLIEFYDGILWCRFVVRHVHYMYYNWYFAFVQQVFHSLFLHNKEPRHREITLPYSNPVTLLSLTIFIVLSQPVCPQKWPKGLFIHYKKLIIIIQLLKCMVNREKTNCKIRKIIIAITYIGQNTSFTPPSPTLT